MRERRLLPHAILGFALAMSLSCREPTGPTSVTGIYALSLVAGAPLPAEVMATESMRFVALADTLRLRPEGTGTETTIQATEYRQTGAPPTAPWRSDRDLHYRLIGSRVEITFDCPSNAFCVLSAGPHLIGDLSASGLRVTYAGGQPVPQDYVTVASTP